MQQTIQNRLKSALQNLYRIIYKKYFNSNDKESG
jgi:hypothetical protein